MSSEQSFCPSLRAPSRRPGLRLQWPGGSRWSRCVERVGSVEWLQCTSGLETGQSWWHRECPVSSTECEALEGAGTSRKTQAPYTEHSDSELSCLAHTDGVEGD